MTKGENMNLELNKQEFETLLDLVYTGNLMINGFRAKEERIQPHSHSLITVWSGPGAFKLCHAKDPHIALASGRTPLVAKFLKLWLWLFCR